MQKLRLLVFVIFLCWLAGQQKAADSTGWAMREGLACKENKLPTEPPADSGAFNMVPEKDGETRLVTSKLNPLRTFGASVRSRRGAAQISNISSEPTLCGLWLRDFSRCGAVRILRIETSPACPAKKRVLDGSLSQWSGQEFVSETHAPP